VTVRPLHARAAASNTASIKALLRCGFTLVETKFSPESPNGRYLACEESSFILER
jgi:RimJ/RimL family protein N-acetyltransferase